MLVLWFMLYSLHLNKYNVPLWLHSRTTCDAIYLSSTMCFYFFRNLTEFVQIILRLNSLSAVPVFSLRWQLIVGSCEICVMLNIPNYFCDGRKPCF